MVFEDDNMVEALRASVNPNFRLQRRGRVRVWHLLGPSV